jgi:hypothetical protein
MLLGAYFSGSILSSRASLAQTDNSIGMGGGQTSRLVRIGGSSRPRPCCQHAVMARVNGQDGGKEAPVPCGGSGRRRGLGRWQPVSLTFAVSCLARPSSNQKSHNSTAALHTLFTLGLVYTCPAPTWFGSRCRPRQQSSARIMPVSSGEARRREDGGKPGMRGCPNLATNPVLRSRTDRL